MKEKFKAIFDFIFIAAGMTVAIMMVVIGMVANVDLGYEGIGTIFIGIGIIVVPVITIMVEEWSYNDFK